MTDSSPGDMPRYEEYPPKLTMEVVDFILFCCEKDEKEALEFMNEVIGEGCNMAVDIKGYMYNDYRFDEDREFQSVDAITSVGVQAWFYITENFIADVSMQLYKDEHLMKSILQGPKRNSVIPVWTKSKGDYSEIPYGMAAFTGLYRTDNALGRKITRMFDHQRHKAAKQQMIEKQKQDKMKWKELETARRVKKRQLGEEQHQRKLENVERDVQKESKIAKMGGKLERMLEDKLNKIIEQLVKLKQVGNQFFVVRSFSFAYATITC